MSSDTVEIRFKAPNKYEGDMVTLQLPWMACIGDVKEKLSQTCSERPEPGEITLIYAGKILKDVNATLDSILATDTCQHVMHMVIKSSKKDAQMANFSTSAIEKKKVESSARAAEIGENHIQNTNVQRDDQNECVKKDLSYENQNRMYAKGADGTKASEGCSSKVPENTTTEEQEGKPASNNSQSTPADLPALFPQFQDLYITAYNAAYQAAAQVLRKNASGNVPDNETIHKDVLRASSSTQPYIPVAAPMLLSMPMMALPMPVAYPNLAVRSPAFKDPRVCTSSQRAESNNPHENLASESDRRPGSVDDILRELENMEQRRLMPPGLMSLARFIKESSDDETSASTVKKIVNDLDRQGAFGVDGITPELRRILQDERVSNLHRRQDNDAQREPVAGRAFRLHIRINLRSLLQFALLTFVIYQHCPLKRFAMLLSLGIALYLTTTPRIRGALQQLIGFRPRQPQDQANLAGDLARENNGEGALQERAQRNPPDFVIEDANEQIERPARREELNRRVGGGFGVFQEILRFFGGFLASLLPAMEPNQNAEAQQVL